MKSSGSNTARVARRLRRWGLHLALLAVGMVILQASECSKEDFYDPFGGLSPLTGDIFGTVRLDGELESGATVTVRQNQTVVGTDVTDANGVYRVSGLDPGTYGVTGTVTGAECEDEQAVVTPNSEIEVNLACETPAPQTGTVTGTVTVNDVGEPNVTVRLRDGATVIATTTTGSNGTYSFTNQATGTRIVEIDSPDGADCPGPQEVNVQANQTATANFPCMSTPQHPSGAEIQSGWSGTRTRTSTMGGCPAPIADAWTGSATFTPPNTLGLTGWDSQVSMVSGTYNQTLGSYDGTGSVVLQNGFEVTANVGGTFGFTGSMPNFSGTLRRQHRFPAGGTLVCEETYTLTGTKASASSIRFKRDVLSLLPDDARPLGLRPVAFRYVEPWGDPAEPRIGLIAEEVAEVFPAAVFLDVEGRPESIHYGILTKAVVDEVEARAAGAARAAIARLAEVF